MQLLFFVAYIAPVEWYDLGFSHNWRSVFICISILGGFVLCLAALQLNRNLSPFPVPKKDGELVQSGLFRYMRHPIYTGILLLLGGYGVYDASLYKLWVAVALWVLFYFKSSFEEQLLEEKFPEYKNYKKKVGRFWPKLFN